MNNSEFSLVQGSDTNLTKSVSTKYSVIRCKARLTIISTALPKVALSNPPRVCPTLAASCSVDQDSSSASGNIAKKLMANTATGYQFWAVAMTERGMKTRRRFALEQ